MYKISSTSIFSLFFILNHDFINLILPTSQLQTQQVMASQISSHMEYIIYTHYILVLLYSQN